MIPSRCFLWLFVLFCIPLTLTAAEAVADANPARGDWLEMVAMVLGTLITLFVLPYLKNKSAQAAAEATTAKFDASKSLLEQKNYLIDGRLMPFLWNTAAYLTEVRLPQWMGRIANRQFEGIWTDLVDELKDLAKTKFAAEGINIVEVIGDAALTSLIKRAVLDKLPIPNGIKDPAGFMIDKVVPLLTSKGVEWIRNKIDDGEDDEIDVAVATAKRNEVPQDADTKLLPAQRLND